MDRVLRNTAATITVTFFDGSSPAEADGTVTILAKRADGSTLLSTNATNEAAVGEYSVVIPPQANLNILTLTWSGTFTGTPITIESTVEIVGAFYFSIAELRNYDKALENVTRFPIEDLINARTFVESEFEDICDRAFVPRFHRETGVEVDPDTGQLWLEKPEITSVLSVSTDGTDQSEWISSGYFKKDKYSPSVLHTSSSALSVVTAIDVTMEYEYGMKQAPVLIKQKALKRAKTLLLGQNSTIDERALTMSLPDIGTVNLATPGVRGSETGVPDIDVVLNRYKIDGGAGVY